MSPAQRRAAAWQAVRDARDDALGELLAADPALGAPQTTFGRDQRTLLHLAVLYGRARVVRRLLRCAAVVPDARDAHGHSALMQAVWVGADRAALTLLLAQRPLDVAARYADGSTMLHHAARSSTLDAPAIVFALAERGADINASNNEFANRFLFFFPFSSLLCVVLCTSLTVLCVCAFLGNRFDTPLHLAVHCGNTKTVRALLDLGADRSLRNSRGETALDVATRCSHSTLVRMIEPQYYLDQIASFGITIPPPQQHTPASPVTAAAAATPV